MKLVLEESDYRSVFDSVGFTNTDQDSILRWLPDEVHVTIAGHVLSDLRNAVPERATWQVPENIEGPALARDSLLFAGMLSVWKCIRLMETFGGGWKSGALGFDGVAAAVVLRAAMEEAARLALAGRAAISVSELNDGSPSADALLDLAGKLLDSGEETGLDGTPFHLRLFDSVWSAASQSPRALLPGGQEAAKAIYGYLSTFVHPKGVSRRLFRNQNFVESEYLTLHPSKAQSMELMGACLAGYTYVAEVCRDGWRDLYSCAEVLDAQVAEGSGFALFGQPADFSARIAPPSKSERADAVLLRRRGLIYEVELRS